MEAICSSETSGATQRITRRHIPEDDTLHSLQLFKLKYVSTFSADPPPGKRPARGGPIQNTVRNNSKELVQ
jgi:hypothetical protein